MKGSDATHELTPEQVARWLADMEQRGHAMRRECARFLGVTPTTMSTMARSGVSGPVARRTALAMRATLEGLEPYR